MPIDRPEDDPTEFRIFSRWTWRKRPGSTATDEPLKSHRARCACAFATSWYMTRRWNKEAVGSSPASSIHVVVLTTCSVYEMSCGATGAPR